MSNDEKSRNPGPCDHGLSDLQSRSYSSTASSSETQESTAYTEYRGPPTCRQTCCRKKASRRAAAGHRGEHGMRTERRSEEHTSELQSRLHLVCRLLLV